MYVVSGVGKVVDGMMASTMQNNEITASLISARKKHKVWDMTKWKTKSWMFLGKVGDHLDKICRLGL
jgi:hypothetical protein